MRSIAKLSTQTGSLIGLGMVMVLALGLVITTLLGARVSTVFSSINSGLSYPGSGGGSMSSASQSALANANEPLPAQANLPVQERMIIRNASLTIEVADVGQADEQIRALINQAGGYILTSSTSGEGNEMSVVLSTRVPAAQFDTALSAVQSVAAKVRQRSVSGEDVTEEFVDLTSRLHNLEITRDRVETMMGQATKISDMLTVSATLSDIQGQIEQIQGRMQYLSQNANLSTIDVSIQPVPVVPIMSEQGWQPVAVARGALHDVIVTGQGLINLLIVIVIWMPLIVPPLLLAWWAWRRFRRDTHRSGEAA
ncbi:MAG: DUF4349 domain-containing protein [Oscillochloris sp.]|nr:DUF4349 domain-containing protein [Oscillochloris sp.]